MPFRSDTSFDRKTDLAWYNLQSQWVVVTYTHHDKWAGPVPSYQGDRLTSVMGKLRGGKSLRIVALGMSITRGMDVSSYDGVAPYMPPYMSLFADGLRRWYPKCTIELFNEGLPGAAVSWGAEYADKYVNPLHPDLVVIDFGMNDFWRLTPAAFGDSVQTIMRKARVGNPGVSFLLIGNMAFDPEYVLDSDTNKAFYVGNMEGYATVLKKMEGKGVMVLDMMNLSKVIYARKKARDCIVNPLHPNDYLARWYGQGLISLLTAQ